MNSQLPDKLFRSCLLLWASVASLLVVVVSPAGVGAQPASELIGKPTDQAIWVLQWKDEFNGVGGVNTADWIYDIGTGYPGGPPNWGTGEVETMTNSTDNVFQNGGFLNIRALHTNSNATVGWTSGRIETVRADFQPPAGQQMAVEASIQLPNLPGNAALGYWPAFWMLGAPYRGNYWNWPSVGEIDIMENVNGLNQMWGVFHCGVNSGGPCNEPTGRARTCSGFSPSLQTAFHTYRLEWDRSILPNQFRWYVDGVQCPPPLNSNEVDVATWNNATNHGFFIILNLAMGGGFPGAYGGGPAASTVSGGTMLVDYVRVYYSSPLAPPVLKFPDTAHPPQGLRPFFDWDSVSGADSYNLQVATDRNFAALVVNINVTPPAHILTTDLPRGTTLYWRVRGNNQYGQGNWSPVHSFDTPDPPRIPTGLTPAGGGTMTSLTPTLDWKDSIPAAERYEVQIATDSGFVNVLGRGQGGPTAVSQYMPETPLEANTTYYWRVRAYGGATPNGQILFSEWSGVMAFKTPP
jgi:beta-glucanase (GH16 family)